MNSQVTSSLRRAKRRVGRSMFDRVPIVRRRMQHKMITKSGLYDRQWVRSQLPAHSRFAGTLDDYLENDLYREGISPNPLLEPAFCPPDGDWLAEPITAYLTGKMPQAHPLFDDALYRHLNPAAATHPGRAVGHFLESANAETTLPTRWLPESERLTWQQFQASPPPRPASVSCDLRVVVNDSGPSIAAIHSAAAWVVAAHPQRARTSTEVLIAVTNASERRVLDSLSKIYPDLRVGIGDDAADTRFTAVVARGCLVEPGWIDESIKTLRTAEVAAVAPLTVGWDGLILDHGLSSAGATDLPFAAQRGLPPIDRLPTATKLTSLGPFAVLFDSVILKTLDLPPSELASHSNAELSRRLKEHGSHDIVAAGATATVSEAAHGGRGCEHAVVSDADATSLRAAAAIDDVATLPPSDSGVVTAAVTPASKLDNGWELPRQVYARVSADTRQRWALRVAAPSGRIGDRWGDVAFAQDLAEALTEVGQLAFVERVDQAHRPGQELDDAALVLRGLERLKPSQAATNILWVISHPDLVAPEELADFDVVFAASESWARAHSRPGVAVRELLQATNPRRFYPDADVARSDSVLFVGSSREQLRPIVRDAVAVDAKLSVYGTGWNGRIDSRFIVSDFVSPENVGQLYREAGVVLSDEWDDMAKNGFIVNRLFDAVASGANVVSVKVSGLEDVLGDRVSTYSTADDLRALLNRDSLRTLDQRTADAQWVRTHHSFVNRARVLVDCVRSLGESSRHSD